MAHVQADAQSGNNNQCGVMYGVAWSPDATHINMAHGRNDEGVYYWFANIDEDNDGYNTTDQGDGIVDAFPEGTQWNDTDADGYGDNPAPANEPDECPTYRRRLNRRPLRLSGHRW